MPALLAIAAAVVVAGLVVRAGGGRPEREPADSAGPTVIARGAVRVPVAPGWSTGARPSRLPGLAVADPVVLANRRSKVQLVVETLPATSRTLLPAAFVKGLVMELPAPTTVRLGGRLMAYHYAGLVHPQVGGLLDLYVAPTTAGIVTASCLAEAVESLLEGCSSVVLRLTITRGRSLPLDGTAAFRQVLASQVAALDVQSARIRRALGEATTAAEQARAFAPVPATYRDAAAAVAPLAPRSPAWPHRVVASLERTGTAYERLRRSLMAADLATYDRAQDEVRAQRARLRRLLDRFSTLPIAEDER